MRHFFIKTACSIFMLSNLQTSWADHLINCPDVSELTGYHVELSVPITFYAKNKSVQFASVALDRHSLYAEPHRVMVLYPIPTGLAGNPTENTKAVIGQLQLETPTAVTYSWGEDIKQIPMCIYSMPGKNHFTAFLFENSGEDRLDHSTQGKASMMALIRSIKTQFA